MCVLCVCFWGLASVEAPLSLLLVGLTRRSFSYTRPQFKRSFCREGTAEVARYIPCTHSPTPQVGIMVGNYKTDDIIHFALVLHVDEAHLAIRTTVAHRMHNNSIKLMYVHTPPIQGAYNT